MTPISALRRLSLVALVAVSFVWLGSVKADIDPTAASFVNLKDIQWKENANGSAARFAAIGDIPGHTTSTVIGMSETSAAGSTAREDVCARPEGLLRDPGAATSVCERSDLRRQGVQECVGMEDVNEVPTVEQHDVFPGRAKPLEISHGRWR